MMSADDAAVGSIRRSRPEPWTGEKKFKGADGCPCPTQVLIPSSSDDAADETMMQIPSQIQEEEGSVFSAEDDITTEEYFRDRRKLGSGGEFIGASELIGKDRIDMYRRMADLRIKEYKYLKDHGYIPHDTAAPDPERPFENVFKLGPSVFGWTLDDEHCCLAGMIDYQRIVPMRTYFDEYLDWDAYRTTFSKYDTDVQYVKYCDELSKKIKWIQSYHPSDNHQQFHQTHGQRGRRQAFKIAAGFSCLSLSLALRGYEEYLLAIVDESELKDNVHVAFELWKRVIKQQMSFEDALKQTLSENTFYFPRRIAYQMKSGFGLVYDTCRSCIDRIDVVEDDKALKLVKDLANEKFRREKYFVDYVKKKLEFAHRIGLTEEFHGNLPRET